MIFNTWESRKQFLVSFQKALRLEFGEADYIQNFKVLNHIV